MLLTDLLLKELRPYATAEERILFRGPSLRLKPKAALALGMVLHELATNAAKYGALSGDRGRVTVDWATKGEGVAARLILSWAEEGGPPIKTPQERRGFGSELMNRQVRHDLGGDIEMDFAEAGLHVTLTFPVSTTAAPNRNTEKWSGDASASSATQS